MDFKELARKFGSVLIMNGDQPEFVVLSYDKYQALENGASAAPVPAATPVASAPTQPSKTTPDPQEQKLIENLNKEIQALNEEIKAKEV